MSDDRLRTAPAERFAPGHLVLDLYAEAAALEAEQPANRHGHRQKTLYKHGGRTVALFVLEPGGGLPEHAAAGIVTIQALEGEVDVTAAGQPCRLAPGQLLAMAPGVRHDVRGGAGARAVFLLQVSLTPASP